MLLKSATVVPQVRESELKVGDDCSDVFNKLKNLCSLIALGYWNCACEDGDRQVSTIPLFPEDVVVVSSMPQ